MLYRESNWAKLKMDTLMQNHNFAVYYKLFNSENECSFRWEIESFSSLLRRSILCSPRFQLMSGQNCYVKFQIKDHLFLYLCFDECNGMEIHSQTIIKDVDDTIHISGIRNYQGNLSFDLIPNLLLSYDEIPLLPNDNLIIICNLKTKKGEQLSEKISKEIKNMSTMFLMDTKKMYDDEIHTDVNLIMANGDIIKAHKAILCLRSPIFAKMFEHNLQESLNSAVNIEHASTKVFKQFIGLLYYPILQKDFDFNLTLELYYCADKYKVLNLRDCISGFLLSLMQENNCLQLLVLSDLHGDLVLKLDVMKFIKNHINNIVHSNLWEEFVISNSKLAASLMTNLFDKLQIDN